MKLIAGILLLGITAADVCGQNPNIITNTKNKLDAAAQQKTSDTNAALGTSETPSTKSPSSRSPYSGAKASGTTSLQSQSKTRAAARPKGTIKVATIGQPSSTSHAQKTQAPKETIAVENTKTGPDGNPSEEPKAINLNGHRDPFVSPVVSRAMTGSGCSTGKRCLAIDQINLRGVVKSDDGMIAVVVNALDKAYFLHENDPVFNGYVVRITGDSVIFKETVQDKFGKPFTREVTKKIFTPAV
jgi:Tfp pilus assembly protein PilP